MRILEAKPIYESTEDQNNAFVRKLPKRSDADGFLVDKQDTKVIDKTTGKTVAIVLRNALDIRKTKTYYKSLIRGNAFSRKTMNRGDASGVKKIYKVRSNGILSKTMETPEGVESLIIGYFDRYPRINFCRPTSFTQQKPLHWQAMVPYFHQVDDLYRENAPEEYLEQKKISDVTSPDFKIGDTVFTTVTVNRNFRTAYHRDAGNLHEGLACMSFIRTGKFSGGDLIMPNYRLGITLRNLDLIIFDNIQIHGNTEILPFGKEKYERITSVFFYRKNMIYCGTSEDELKRAKRNKGDQIIGPTTEDLNKWK